MAMGDKTRIREAVKIGLSEVFRGDQALFTPCDLTLTYKCHSCGNPAFPVNFYIVKGSWENQTVHECCDECATSGRGKTHGVVVKKEDL